MPDHKNESLREVFYCQYDREHYYIHSPKKLQRFMNIVTCNMHPPKTHSFKELMEEESNDEWPDCARIGRGTDS